MGLTGSKSVVALALAAALVLSGCSSKFAGASTFGSNKIQTAELSTIGSYDADRSLVEARAHFRNRDFGYSAQLYKRVVELSPNNAEGYVGLGASYDRLRRFDLSDRVYAALHELSGDSAQYYNNLGYSFLLRGKLKEAMTHFQRAQRLAPDSVVVANNIRLVERTRAQARA